MVTHARLYHRCLLSAGFVDEQLDSNYHGNWVWVNFTIIPQGCLPEALQPHRSLTLLTPLTRHHTFFMLWKVIYSFLSSWSWLSTGGMWGIQRFSIITCTLRKEKNRSFYSETITVHPSVATCKPSFTPLYVMWKQNKIVMFLMDT